jgi:hypothetical protein
MEIPPPFQQKRGRGDACKYAVVWRHLGKISTSNINKFSVFNDTFLRKLTFSVWASRGPYHVCSAYLGRCFS